MGNFLKTLTALMLVLVAMSVSAAGVDIQVQNSWVMAAPPNVKVFAAYMEIKNAGKKPRTLTDVSSPAFGQIGIHQTVMHGNMVHMEQLKELTIPPQASVVLKPGGSHLMLSDAKKTPRIGDQIPMTLTFSDGEKITFTAIVRTDQTVATEGHQHTDHSEHNHKP
jgi:copper(I)-binding protein